MPPVILAAVAVTAVVGGSKALKAIAGAGLIIAGIATGNLTLISLGASIGSSALKSGKQTQPSPENANRLRANIDVRTPRKSAVGITALATDIRDEEITGNQDYLHRFIVTSSHKIQSHDEVWFDDKLAWSAAGGVTSEFASWLVVESVTEGSAANAKYISSRMGYSRRYTGCSYVYLRYRISGTNSPFAQSITTRITIKGKAASLYDPRRDSTVPGGSGSQRANNQATWTWDANACRNPALALLFYLLGWSINGELAVGKGIPASRIDLESFAIAANICDETVATPTGTEPRYRCDGVWSEGDSPTAVIDMLKSCMNADLDDVDGKLRLTIFTDTTFISDADFTADDIIGKFDWQPERPLESTYNIVRGVYTDPSSASLYQQVDYPQVKSTSPDGIDRIDTFNLPMVESPTQAQRLAELRKNRQEYGGIFKAEFQATAWRVQKNSIVRLTFPRRGFVNKTFRVAEIDLRVDGIVPLTLVEENPAIYVAPAFKPAVVAASSTPYDPFKDPILTGITDAAKTALWPNITGTGKPADNADVTGANIAAGIAGQQDLATTPRAALPFGANLAVNSEFVLMDPTYGGGVIPVGWQQSWNGDSTNLGSVAFNDRRVQLKDSSYGFARDLTGAPNGSVVDCVSGYPITAVARYMVPVLPGERIVASARVGYQNCTGVYVVIGFFDENGTYVDEYGGTAITASIGAAAYNTLTRNDLALTTMVTTVPADGTGAGTGKRRWAAIWTRFNISGSPTNPRLITSAPMIAKVPSNQTAIPAYTPGPADRQASYGATTGTSLTSPTYGTLSDAQIKTDLGTAAAVVGQSAWATYSSLTPQQVAQIVPNMVYNPTGVLGLDGWTVNSGSVAGVKGNYNEGYYFSTSSGSNVAPVNFYQDVPIAAGQSYTISADIYAYNITVSSGIAQARVYIQWLNGSGAHISYSATAAVGAGTGWTHVTAIGQVAPAGAVTARVWCDVWGSGVYSLTSVAWSKVKLQMGSVDTLFTDDASYGARYQSGVSIEALKPAQVGADKTSTNTAAAIAGQGDLATANRSSLAFGDNAIVNSEFTAGSDGLTNWSPPGAPCSGWLNLTGWFGRRNVAYMTLPGAALTSGSYYDFAQTGFWNGGGAAAQRRNGISVKQGDNLYIRSLVGAHRCVAQVYLLIFDSSGTLVEAPGWTGGRNGGGANGDPANFDVLGGCYSVTAANASTAQFMIRMLGTGGSDPYVFFTEPAMGILPAGQTTLPPYKPGRTDPAADQTGANVAAAIAGQAATATNSDYGAITGTKPPSDADKTSINIAAGIVGQGDLATASRSSLPFGSNGFTNSDLTATAVGWEFIPGNNASLGGSGGRNQVTGYFGRRNVAHTAMFSASAIGSSIYMFGPSTKGFWAGGASDVKRFGLPVKTNERVYLGGKYAVHGGTQINIRARFHNENGVIINEQDVSFTIGDARRGGPTGGSGDPDNFAERGGYFTVPAGAFYATWGCYTYSSGTDSNVYIFVTDPILARVPAGQNATMIYTPGAPDRASDTTSENIAAAVVGQQRGATANSLADLDPTAAATLASLTGGASQVATYGDVIQIRIAAGASVSFTGCIKVDGGSAGFATVQCLLQSSVAGANSFSTFASGSGQVAGPGEPAADTASGTFTNATGIEQVFDFRVEIGRTPSGTTVGGSAIISQTYIAN